MLPYPMVSSQSSQPPSRLLNFSSFCVPAFRFSLNLQTFQHVNLLTFPRAIPFRIRIYEKCVRNPFGICTSKTQDLKGDFCLDTVNAFW